MGNNHEGCIRGFYNSSKAWYSNMEGAYPKSEYVAKVESMTDEEPFKEIEQKIWLSAYANNNPRSDYH